MKIEIDNSGRIVITVKEGETVPNLSVAQKEVKSWNQIGNSTIPVPRNGELYITSFRQPSGLVRHVFLLPGETEKNWRDGKKWAHEQGGELPDRIVFAFLKTFMADEFKKKAYWMCERGSHDMAWYQGFEAGSQGLASETNLFFVRAVRSEFTES